MKINNNPPHRNAIRLLMNKFEQTGSVLNIDPPGRPVSVADQATKDEISSILEEEPQTRVVTGLKFSDWSGPAGFKNVLDR
jgi:hypothetical protein